MNIDIDIHKMLANKRQQLQQRYDSAVASAKRTDEEETGGRYEPILKNKPVAVVPHSEALDFLIDVSTMEEATIQQVNYCRYLMVTIPGKYFCDASWLLEAVIALQDTATLPTLNVDYWMPNPHLAEVGNHLDQVDLPDDYFDDDDWDDEDFEDDDDDGNRGSGGPLVPSGLGPDGGVSPQANQ